MQYNTIRYVVAVLGACLCALSAEARGIIDQRDAYLGANGRNWQIGWYAKKSKRILYRLGRVEHQYAPCGCSAWASEGCGFRARIKQCASRVRADPRANRCSRNHAASIQ